MVRVDGQPPGTAGSGKTTLLAQWQATHGQGRAVAEARQLGLLSGSIHLDESLR